MNAKKKGLNEVVDTIRQTTDKVFEIAKDFQAPPSLRQEAWELLIHLEEPGMTDVAFELVTRDDEQEGVLNYVREEIKRYADENRYDARRRLYDILSTLKKGTTAYQRILYLLQAIRYPQSSLGLRIDRFVPETESNGT